MTKVTKDEFWAHIFGLTVDVHPRIQPGPYPYTSVFLDRHNRVYGQIVGAVVNGQSVSTYFKPEVAQ
jgi:hypothetical protein